MKKVMFSTLLAFFTVVNIYAKGGCELSQVGAVEVHWSAYKTPKKLPVGGGFDSVAYTPVAKSGKNFRSILVGSSVVIDTTSVNSNHKERDVKLVKFFFAMMQSKNIEAKIVDIKADKRKKGAPRTGYIDVAITMNSVKKVVPMQYSFKEGTFEAKGVIDILDFSASSALEGINKACYDLHQGKTWSDVQISFKTKIEALLCSAKPLKTSR